MRIALVLSALLPVFAICGCKSMAASAEEYYSIGMAYFDLGKYEEAEMWLNRAKQGNKTMTASQYNLGRLAYERQRYEEAAKIFEDILKKDPNNVLALQAAAYSRIRTGELPAAERHYSKLLTLVPESADDGYNHALVLHAMERYSDAERVLENYQLSILENNDMQLLYARTLNAQDKAEAIDIYVSWLINNSDPKIRYEYAQALEKHELYARALEEYRKALSETPAADRDLQREIRFSSAKLLLIADSESSEGITELQAAITEGFDNIGAIEELLLNERISDANKDNLRSIINNMLRAETQKETE